MKALKPKEAALMQALLEGYTITKAAQIAGISRKTAYRYRQNPAFEQEYNRRCEEILNATVRYVQQNLDLCYRELVRIIESPQTSAQIKINAINAFLQGYKAANTDAEILSMALRIEERLNESEL